MMFRASNIHGWKVKTTGLFWHFNAANFFWQKTRKVILPWCRCQRMTIQRSDEWNYLSMNGPSSAGSRAYVFMQSEVEEPKMCKVLVKLLLDSLFKSRGKGCGVARVELQMFNEVKKKSWNWNTQLQTRSCHLYLLTWNLSCSNSTSITTSSVRRCDSFDKDRSFWCVHEGPNEVKLLFPNLKSLYKFAVHIKTEN